MKKMLVLALALIAFAASGGVARALPPQPASTGVVVPAGNPQSAVYTQSVYARLVHAFGTSLVYFDVGCWFGGPSYGAGHVFGGGGALEPALRYYTPSMTCRFREKHVLPDPPGGLADHTYTHVVFSNTGVMCSSGGVPHVCDIRVPEDVFLVATRCPQRDADAGNLNSGWTSFSPQSEAAGFNAPFGQWFQAAGSNALGCIGWFRPQQPGDDFLSQNYTDQWPGALYP